MITPADLSQFIGTTCYHRHAPRLVLTDGAQFAAENLGCYWLMDIVWSVLPLLDDQADGFAVVELKKIGESQAVVTIHDGGQNGAEERTIYSQKIDYTDFPWDEFTLYVGLNYDIAWVIMLPSEY